MTNDNKISFVTCVNNETIYEKCLDFLNKLIVPPNITVEYKAVRDAVSMCAGYNKAIMESNARYKVYLHQDTYITYSYYIHRLLKLFEDMTIGLAGVIGAQTMPASCVWWESGSRYGRVVDSSFGFLFEQRHRLHLKNKYEEVVAIDGLIMATQYDIPWRDDLFKGWHFYDVSQCLEFRRAGYKVVVPMQPCSQVTHVCGVTNLDGYFEYRDVFKAEYSADISKLHENPK